MFRKRNSKERKGDEKRNSIQIRSSLIPKLRPRPTIITKTQVSNTATSKSNTTSTTTTKRTVTSIKKNSNTNNNNSSSSNRIISGRVTRKSTNNKSISPTFINSRKSALPKLPAKLSLIPTKRPPLPSSRQVKVPAKDITNTTSSSRTSTIIKTATTTNSSNISTKPNLPGYLRPTASSLGKSRKRPSLTLVKASPTPTKNIIKKARRDQPNPKKNMESRKEKRESYRSSNVIYEEDEEEDLKKNDHHHQDSNSDTDSCPPNNNNPTTEGGAMDVEDIRRDDTINEESFAQKCLIEIHSTPKCTTKDVHSGLSLARRAILRQGKKVHPTTILNDASAKQNAKLNFSFGMDSDDDDDDIDDDALVPDCEAYEIFSTPIKNFASSVSSPPNSTSDNDDEESIYFTPCGEI